MIARGLLSMKALASTPKSSTCMSSLRIWELYPNNVDGANKDKCTGLYLEFQSASSLPSYLMVNTNYVLGIHDQLHNQHCEKRGKFRHLPVVENGMVIAFA